MSNSYYSVMPIPAIIDNFKDRFKGYEILVDGVRPEDLYNEVPRITYEIRKILWENGAAPILIYTSLPVDNKLILLVVFDKKDISDIRVESIRNKISRINKIKKVSEAKRYSNIIFSEKLFYFNLLDSRWILIGPAFMKALIIELRSTIGENVSDILLLTLGKTIGETVYDYYTSLGRFENISDIIGFLEMMLSISGWARVEDYDIRKDKISITVADLWECDIIFDNGTEIKPQLFKGILNGFFSKIFNKEVTVHHVSIRKKNNSIYCAFEITR